MGVASWLISLASRPAESMYFARNEEILSYHNSEEIKQSVLGKWGRYRARHSAERNSITAVWTGLKNTNANEARRQFEAEIGVPAWVALFANDLISHLVGFDSNPGNRTLFRTYDKSCPSNRELRERALLLPERVFGVIPVGVKLLPSWYRLCAWLHGTTSPLSLGNGHDLVVTSIQKTRDLYERASHGEVPDAKEWNEAYSNLVIANEMVEAAKQSLGNNRNHLDAASSSKNWDELVPLLDALMSVRAAKHAVEFSAHNLCGHIDHDILSRFPVTISEQFLLEVEGCRRNSRTRQPNRELWGVIQSRQDIALFLDGNSTDAIRPMFVVSSDGAIDYLSQLRPHEGAFRDWYNPQTGWIHKCSTSDLKRLDKVRIRPENNGKLEVTTFAPHLP